jgi:arylsulfatase A-like enzyme
MYEGGLRVPLIVRWPGRVTQPGLETDVPVTSPDLLPTVLAAAGIDARVDAVAGPGVDASVGATVDGISLLPLLGGNPVDERPLFWHYPHYGNQGGAPSAAIRRGDWKLIEWQEDGRVELFDVAHDIGETEDRASAEPARVAQLRDELRAWQREVGAVMPTSNPRHDAAAPSGRAAARPQ